MLMIYSDCLILNLCLSILVFLEYGVPLRLEYALYGIAIFLFFQYVDERGCDRQEYDTQDNVFDIDTSTRDKVASEVTEVGEAYCPE